MGLKRELRVIDIFSLALGAIIGWGCFVLPGTDFLPQAGPLGTLLGLSAGGIMVSIIGFNYGFLIEKYPEAGGEFVYAYRNLGPIMGFICGWFLLLSYISIIPMNATAIAMVGRYIFPGVLQHGYLYSVAGWEVYLGEVIAATLFLVLFAWINIRGVRSMGNFQTLLVVLLVGTVLILTGSTFFLHESAAANLSPAFPTGITPLAAVMAICAMAPWAFSGFDCIPQATEEYNFSHKKSKVLIMLSIAFAVLMYVCMTLVTAAYEPWEGFLASAPLWPTGESVNAVTGTPGMVLLAIAMLCAVISGINGFYMSASRLIYSMSVFKALPPSFSKLSKTSTPKNAILFILLISLFAPWFGRQVLSWIVDMCSVGVSVAYFITSMVAFRRSKGESRPFIRVTGVLGMLVSLVFLALLLVPGMPGFLAPESLIMLGIWVVLGACFLLFKRRHQA